MDLDGLHQVVRGVLGGSADPRRMAALSQAERRALRAWSRSALFSLSADGAVRRRAPEVDSFIWATDRRPTLEH